MELSEMPLFYNIEREDIEPLLNCLGAVQKQYKKGSIIFSEGKVIEQLGIVLEGRVLMQYSDAWGTGSILGSAKQGETFGEAYACSGNEPLQISVVAAENTKALFLNVNRVLTVCPSSCGFHTKLVRNLLSVCAQKNLELSRRMMHITPKSIRGRLISYFSECSKKAKNNAFEISYNRQQLADHLGVDRSAMCSELSKMQREGLIQYKRNQITICEESGNM